MPDGKPVIGAVPGLSNLFLAAGHEGEGLSLVIYHVFFYCFACSMSEVVNSFHIAIWSSVMCSLFIFFSFELQILIVSLCVYFCEDYLSIFVSC